MFSICMDFDSETVVNDLNNFLHGHFLPELMPVQLLRQGRGGLISGPAPSEFHARTCWQVNQVIHVV